MNLLLDHPALSPTRPTDDVDVIVETVISRRHSEVEAALRCVGFAYDIAWIRQGHGLVAVHAGSSVFST